MNAGSSKNRWTSKHKIGRFDERGQRNKVASKSGGVSVGMPRFTTEHMDTANSTLELLSMGDNKRLLNPKVCQKGQHGLAGWHSYPISASGDSAWLVPSREHHLPMGKPGFRAARAWAGQTELQMPRHSAPLRLAVAQRGKGKVVSCLTQQQTKGPFKGGRIYKNHTYVNGFNAF